MHWRGMALVLVLSLGLVAGCGSDDPSDGARGAPTIEQVQAAEDAVRAELTANRQPLWEKATYTGFADGSDICVEVDIGTILGEEDDVRYQHRIVELPDLTVGEPEEGPC